MTAPIPAQPAEVTVDKKAARQLFWHDLEVKALHTWWQAAAASLITMQPTTNWSELRKACVSAVLAGIAAAFSIVKTSIANRRMIQK